jgi:hypothetical protein
VSKFGGNDGIGDEAEGDAGGGDEESFSSRDSCG